MRTRSGHPMPSFCDRITTESVSRLIKQLTLVLNPLTSTGKRADKVHLLFHSKGGILDDGVFLYNFLRSYPGSLVIYNGGTVQSAGMTAFLACPRRVASAHSTFMMHSVTMDMPDRATVAMARSKVDGCAIEESRIMTLLKSRISLDESGWRQIETGELWFTAEEAVKAGLATEIGEFVAPPGAIFQYV